MATPEQLVEYRKKAYLSPRIGKHGKRKSTIAKEKRRELFDEIISQEFPKIVSEARAEYKLDQFIGKAPDTINVNAKLTIVEMAQEIVKKNALNPSPINDSN